MLILARSAVRWKCPPGWCGGLSLFMLCPMEKKNRLKRWALVTPLVVGGLTFSGPVMADAIDGDWCSVQGKTLSINGPQIDTPGGNRLQGLYDRHGFIYTVPDAEPDAGKEVRMVLVDDNTIRLTVGDGASELQTWRRCRPGTS